MTWYLQYLDLKVWKIIVCGYKFSTKVVDDNKIQTPLEEYDEK